MSEAIVLGREDEKSTLERILESKQPELVAVYGRRRIGKTYLIMQHLKNHFVLEYSGIHNVDNAVQLSQYTKALTVQLNDGVKLQEPADWFEAFDITAVLLKKKLKRKKAVIFLDEFPWMHTQKSNFLPAFEQFWNTWASRQPAIAVILCGSAASWMIKHLVRNKGGLHNRITQKIALQPFTLHETELFLQHKKVMLSRYQVVQLYMAFGGVPHYLNQIQPGQSAVQIIEKACFNKSGFLYNEFYDLYGALFKDAERHYKVVRALAAKPSGLNRKEIIAACKLQSGGSTTALLEELTAAGFITSYIPIGRVVRDNIYKLTDEYTLFFLKFIEPNRSGAKNTWAKISAAATFKSWSGFAFETICLKHIANIKKAMGFSGIYSENAIWRSRGNNSNDTAQIDLVIDRRDNCINLCEIKFTETSFLIDRQYAEALEQKREIFKNETKSKKTLFITLITAAGLTINEHSLGLVSQHLSLQELFTD
jgi:uncharacterized protein